MQLRGRKKIDYGGDDEISDDSSAADGAIAVACKPTTRVHPRKAPRKASGTAGAPILSKGFVSDEMLPVSDSETEDSFQPLPARKMRNLTKVVRRSSRLNNNNTNNTNYEEVSTCSEETRKERVVTVVADSEEEEVEVVRRSTRLRTNNTTCNYEEDSTTSEENRKQNPVMVVDDSEDEISSEKTCSGDDLKKGGRARRAREEEPPRRSKRACTMGCKPETQQVLRGKLACKPETQLGGEPEAEIDEPRGKIFKYSVGKYGLEVNGEIQPALKVLKQQVEKILAVNRSGDHPVFCVKLYGKSHRGAVNVTEALLVKYSPQLLRQFYKRLDSAGRIDGHPGSLEESAFDPRFLVVERIVAVEKRGRIKKFYVKWKGLPYSDATWELEESMAGELEALEKFKANAQPGHPCDTSLSFRDGRSLRDYQQDGVKWLDRNFQLKVNCILADEMGLGKTIQSIAVLENLRLKRRNKGPFLIVAPVSTLGHWQREIESLTDMNCVVYSGSQEDRAIIQEYELWIPRTNTPKFTILLSSFEILMKDRSVLEKIAWQYVIVDEAHRLKSKESKTSSSLRAMNVRPGGLLLLTGTPIQNNTRELFSLLSFLDPEEFNSEEEFMAKYGNIKDIEQVKDLQDNILRPRLLRRMKEDVEKSIPQKEETIIWVELTKEQRTYYRAIYENRVSDLLKGSQASNVPNLRNMAMELRKLCNHPFLCNGLEEDFVSKFSNVPEMTNVIQSSGKMLLLNKLLPKLRDANRRVLIFSQFTIMLDILEDYLSSQGYTFERIDGKIRGSERQAAIDRYSASDSKTFAFLLSTRAGGVGITLTAADTCIIYDSDWNPQNDLQAMARCHRIGQTKDVKIYRLITKNTYEERLFECSSRKYGLDEAVLGKFEADQPDYNKNIESLLRRGAYDILKDDGEEEAAAFRAANIEQILEQRTQQRAIGGRGNNTFSVATFAAVEEVPDEDDVKAEEFWRNMLPEACDRNKLHHSEKKTVLGRRRRNKVDYVEEKQSSDDDDDDSSGGEDSSGETKGSQASPPEELDRVWSLRELSRLERSFSRFGPLQLREVIQDAGLEYRENSEIEVVTQAIVQLCNYVQEKDNQSGDKIIVYPTLPSSVEKAMASSPFMTRLERNAKKLLQAFHEREVISNALKQELSIKLIRSNKLPFSWGEAEDIDLLKGVHIHGHRSFNLIRDDPSLCFASKYLQNDSSEGECWPSNSVLSTRVTRLVKTLVDQAVKASTGKTSHEQRASEGEFCEAAARESPVLKQSSRHKRVLSTPEDVKPPLALLPRARNSGEASLPPPASSKRRKTQSPDDKSKVTQSMKNLNKENVAPKQKNCNSGGKQKSLLGYFQPTGLV